MTVVSNGREAVDAVEKGNFNVVLMDGQMPEMDGFKATAVIREREKRTGRHMQIVALTAHALKGDRERFIAAGMDGYLSKPVNAEDLFRAVESLDSNAPAEDVAPPAEAFDLRVALEHTDGDAELLVELARLFLGDCEQILGGVHDAVERRDAADLSRQAHTLKGSVANFGATAAFQLSQRLENLGRRNELNEAPQVLGELAAALDQLKSSLAELINSQERGQLLSSHCSPVAL